MPLFGRKKPEKLVIRLGMSYTVDDDVELEEVEPAKAREPEDQLSEPWNTDKIPRREWASSGD